MGHSLLNSRGYAGAVWQFSSKSTHSPTILQQGKADDSLRNMPI